MKRVFTIKYFFLFLFFLTTNEVFPQWSTDPNNNLIIGYGLNPELCSDSACGCYITYEVGYPSKLYLHRLDKYGYQPWGDKRIIAGELDEQRNAEIIEDGEGGVIVSFGDRIMHEHTRLRVQKVDSSGNFLWGTTGVKPSLTRAGSGAQKLVADGDGGCVIVWIDTLDEYRINRINRFGQRVWSDSGIYIQSDYNLSPPKLIRASDGNYFVQIRYNLYRIRKNGDIVRQDSTILSFMVPDSEGGIVFSGRKWIGMTPKLTAQRRDSLGNNLWLAPYVEIADSIFMNLTESIHPINEYYFFTWLGKKNGIELVSQYQALRSDGIILFNQGNLQISDYDENASTGYILPSEDNTFVLTWQDNRPEHGVFGQRRDTLNNKLWNSVDVSIDTGIYSVLNVISDGMGGAIGGGWQQSDFSIRAFKVSKNGILGEVINGIDDQDELILPKEIILYQNFPNPFNSSTTIRYELPEEGFVSLKVYDVLGNEVASLINEERQAGYYSIEFNASDLSSGIYFYRLNTGNFSSTKKLLLLK